jgi:hypothetical protein
MVNEREIIKLLRGNGAERLLIEIVLNCWKQDIDDWLEAYFIIKMEELKLCGL